MKEQKEKLENTYNYEWKKLDAELLNISEEKDLLADAEYEQLSKVRTINNNQSSSEMVLKQKILNNATLKKTLNDSILEAQELLIIKRNVLHQNKAEIDRLEKEIQKERKQLFSESQVERNLIQQSINDIKQRLEYLIEKESILKQYRKSKIDLERAKERKKSISESLKENKELLLTADSKATTAMLHYDAFKTMFSKYLKTLFAEIDKCSLDENYMPIIDDNKMTMVSSASLKVAIRITYILALLNSNCGNDGTHVGFLLLDSPKDKDLDDYRFEKYLGIIGKCCEGQILITGSVSDRELYKSALANAHFF